MEPSLRCPSCGNNLAVVDAPMVTCAFCKMTVPVPAMFRRPVQVMVAPQQQPSNPYAAQYARYGNVPPMRVVQVRSSGSPAGAIVAVAMVIMLMGMGAAMFLVRSGSSRQSAPTSSPAHKTAADEPDEQPNKSAPILSFGGKGDGAGRFTDGRAINVGPDGMIYVADYDDGRVQQFDAKGKFVRLIQVPARDPSSPYIDISALATDHAGHLFVARNESILRYATATGALEATFKEMNVWSIAVDPAGTIWGWSEGDETVHLDAQGKVLHRWNGLIRGADKKDPAMSPQIAVDSKHLYVASIMSGWIYVFDTEAHYENRFAVKDESKEIAAGGLDDIGVDPQGNIYVAHGVIVSMFDPSGAFTKDLPRIDGGIRNISFDDKGHLFVMTTQEQKVIELDLSSDE
jgi:streptogramin lyase